MNVHAAVERAQKGQYALCRASHGRKTVELLLTEHGEVSLWFLDGDGRVAIIESFLVPDARVLGGLTAYPSQEMIEKRVPRNGSADH